MNPVDVNVNYNRALVYFDTEHFLEAEQDLIKAIELNPNLAPAYFKLGLCNTYLNKSNDACGYFKQALALGYYAAEEQLEKFCK